MGLELKEYLIKIPLILANLESLKDHRIKLRKYCPLTAACILYFHLNVTMKSSPNYINL